LRKISGICEKLFVAFAANEKNAEKRKIDVLYIRRE